MIDRTTKVLLAVIAAGLWLNIATPIFRSSLAHAGTQDTTYLGDIAFNINELAHGSCTNSKLC